MKSPLKLSAVLFFALPLFALAQGATNINSNPGLDTSGLNPGSGTTQSGQTVNPGATNNSGFDTPSATPIGGPQVPSNPTPIGGPQPPTNTGPNVTLLNPLGANASLSTLVADILAFVVQIGTVIVVLMVVYIGYLFVMARGEPGKLTEARQALLWTIVGALILFGAQAIATAIENTAKALGT